MHVNKPGSYQETLPPCLIEVACMLINQGHIRKHYPPPCLIEVACMLINQGHIRKHYPVSYRSSMCLNQGHIHYPPPISSMNVNKPGSYQETLPPCLIEVACMLINQGHIRKHYPRLIEVACFINQGSRIHYIIECSIINQGHIRKHYPPRVL